MKITILLYGSRGDIQTFVPLSISFMAREHLVKLAALAHVRSRIEKYDIPFVALTGDTEEFSCQRITQDKP
jgi:UDP:flavonoid glycosyltransferase YjiC (YdhE family)